MALSWLALAQLELEDWEQATECARQAVRVEPDSALTWQVLGRVMLGRGKHDQAEEAGQRAIELDPADVDGFGLLAVIYAERKRWKDARSMAEQGLALEPNDEECTNVYAMALRRLGNRDRARRVLAGQLARDPEDPRTHANQGWNELSAGDHDRALEHFREALRLDPELEWAQSGVVAALKARHWFYRPVLRYFLWMQGLGSRAQLAVVIGAYFLYRVLAGLFAAQPLVAALIVVVYGALVLASWFADPIASALLSFHPLGRLALTKRQRAQATVICGMLILGCVLIVIGLRGDSSWATAGLVVVVSSIPIKFVFDLEESGARIGMGLYAGAVTCLGLVAFAQLRRASAESEPLAPIVAEAQAIEQELDALREESQAQLASGQADGEAVEDLEARAAVLEARQQVLHQKTESEELLQIAESVRERRELGQNLLQAFAVLSFLVSQLVYASLDTKSRRH